MSPINRLLLGPVITTAVGEVTGLAHEINPRSATKAIGANLLPTREIPLIIYHSHALIGLDNTTLSGVSCKPRFREFWEVDRGRPESKCWDRLTPSALHDSA